jgi:hypothetical protein
MFKAVWQLQGEQLIVAVIGADAPLNHHAGVVAQRQWQVQACQGFADRAAGQGLAVAEQHEVVGQARHFILGVADIQHRDVQFVVQALQVRQDFAFALGVERRQRFIHQQQFRAGEQRAGDADSLAFPAGQVLRMAIQQVADAQQFGGLGHVDPTLGFRDALRPNSRLASTDKCVNRLAS